MKKLLVLASICLFGLQAMANQNTTEKVEYSSDKYKVETNSFWSNWFVTGAVGPQVMFGDHDKQMKFGKRIAPAFDVAVGKWFTPGIGMRAVFSGQQLKGATQNGAFSNGEPLEGKAGWGSWLKKQKFSMFNLHVDVMFNLNNLFCGYNEKRIWHISPYAGLGWGHVGRSPQSDELTAGIGVFNSFRLCDALDANIDARATYVNDRFDGEAGGRFGEGILSITAGITYKFKERGWSRAKTIYRYDYGDLDAMRDKVNAMARENERLKKALANRKTTETVVKNVVSANLITFPIDESTLDNKARTSLGMLADAIKSADANTVYTITGYADAGTGNAEWNEKLSQARAQAVYDCLVKEFGVKESQLRIEFKGGVDNMFYDDPRVSRAVITAVK